MDSQNSMQQMASLLEQETQLCTRLRAALDAEQDALKQHNPEGLSAAVTQKQECVAALELTEKDLFRIVFEGGYSCNADGLQQYMDALVNTGDPHNIKTLWEKLRLEIVECRKINQINGRIINASMASTQQLLNLLNGRDQVAPTYDQSGKSDDNDGNRSIAIA